MYVPKAFGHWHSNLLYKMGQDFLDKKKKEYTKNCVKRHFLKKKKKNGTGHFVLICRETYSMQLLLVSKSSWIIKP